MAACLMLLIPSKWDSVMDYCSVEVEICFPPSFFYAKWKKNN